MFKKKKAKAGRRKLFSIMITVLTAALAVAVVLLLFHIRKIEVTGNEYISQEEVANWVRLDKYATNSIYVWARYKFTDPDMHPNLDTAEVKIKNPWTVTVRVYEKKMVGFLYYGDQFVYFGRDGVVLAVDLEYREGVPFIEGLEVTGADIYEQLPVEDESIFSALLETTQMLEKCGLSTDRIVCRERQIYLYFGNVCAQVGTSNLEDRILQIPPILEKLDGKKGTLHLENYQDASDMISFDADVWPEEPQNSDLEDNSEDSPDQSTQDVQSE